MLPVLAVTPCVAQAATLISVEDFQKSSFPKDTIFENMQHDLTQKQKTDIGKISTNFLDEIVRFSIAKDKSKKVIGHVVIGKVFGKHEIIVYATAVDSNGKIKAIEILEYSESYGQQVADEEWKTQFVGRDADSNFKLNKSGGIENISGATMSCKHVSNGVKRDILFYEKIIKSKYNS